MAPALAGRRVVGWFRTYDMEGFANASAAMVGGRVERRLVDEPKTLEDLSAKYGISRERVRQIEVRAFDKLQKAMKNMVVDAANESSRKAVEHAAAR